jgi:simple sugar transport system permease protein
VTIAVAFLMISGEFDLSVGAVYAMSGMLLAYLLNQGVNGVFSMLITLVFAFIIGTVNGLITTKVKIPSFIATLGMMMSLRGFLLIASGGFPIGYKGDSILPNILNGKCIGDLRISTIWLLLFLILFTIVLDKTKYGNWVYASGGNPKIAKTMGVEVEKVILFTIVLDKTKYGNWVYASGGNPKIAKTMGVEVEKVKRINFILVAVFAAIAGSFSFGRFGMSYPTLGEGLELEAIASTVIGGCYMAGGYGSVLGAFFGALTIASLRVGLVLAGLVLAGAPAYWYKAFIGIILIIGMIVNKRVMKNLLKIEV